MNRSGERRAAGLPRLVKLRDFAEVDHVGLPPPVGEFYEEWIVAGSVRYEFLNLLHRLLGVNRVPVCERDDRLSFFHWPTIQPSRVGRNVNACFIAWEARSQSRRIWGTEWDARHSQPVAPCRSRRNECRTDDLEVTAWGERWAHPTRTRVRLNAWSAG